MSALVAVVGGLLPATAAPASAQTAGIFISKSLAGGLGGETFTFTSDIPGCGVHAAARHRARVPELPGRARHLHDHRAGRRTAVHRQRDHLLEPGRRGGGRPRRAKRHPGPRGGRVPHVSFRKRPPPQRDLHLQVACRRPGRRDLHLHLRHPRLRGVHAAARHRARVPELPGRARHLHDPRAGRRTAVHRQRDHLLEPGRRGGGRPRRAKRHPGPRGGRVPHVSFRKRPPPQRDLHLQVACRRPGRRDLHLHLRHPGCEEFTLQPGTAPEFQNCPAEPGTYTITEQDAGPRFTVSAITCSTWPTRRRSTSPREASPWSSGRTSPPRVISKTSATTAGSSSPSRLPAAWAARPSPSPPTSQAARSQLQPGTAPEFQNCPAEPGTYTITEQDAGPRFTVSAITCSNLADEEEVDLAARSVTLVLGEDEPPRVISKTSATTAGSSSPSRLPAAWAARPSPSPPTSQAARSSR